MEEISKKEEATVPLWECVQGYAGLVENCSVKNHDWERDIMLNFLDPSIKALKNLHKVAFALEQEVEEGKEDEKVRYEHWVVGSDYVAIITFIKSVGGKVVDRQFKVFSEFSGTEKVEGTNSEKVLPYSTNYVKDFIKAVKELK